MNRIVDKNILEDNSESKRNKEFTLHTGSPILIMPTENKLSTENKIVYRYQDLNKNEVKFRERH